MHMDDLFREMAQNLLTEIIRSHDLHALRGEAEGWVDYYLSFFLFFFFLECFLRLRGNAF